MERLAAREPGGLMETVMSMMLMKAAAAGFAGTGAVYGMSLIGAAVHYRTTAIQLGNAISLKGLLIHLFPAHVMRTRWLRSDISICLSNRLLSSLVFPSTSAMTVLTATEVRAGLAASGITPVGVPWNTISMCLFLLCSLLVRDFASFYIHLLQHRVPLLWEFHKVHHAPESLNPITTHRLHPLELVINLTVEGLLLGILAGTYAWLTISDPAQLITSAVGIYVIISIITFAPLRHSHIDLRLGRLERIFISPAHHRLHHSVDPHHWDKNFGAIFPLWDWLWNTLLQPPRTNTYRLGLPDGKGKDYVTVWKSYVTPFWKIGRSWREVGLLSAFRLVPIANHPPPLPNCAAECLPVSDEGALSR